MNPYNWTLSLVAAALLLAHTGHAQDPLRGTLTMGFGDVAAMKQKAEAGDVSAQVALAGTLAHNFHNAEALAWYRKAANQGSVEAAYQCGHLLTFGAVGIPNNQAVKANPTEGIRWTFQAATNHHASAYHDLSMALQHGTGVKTNIVEAYAWLQLYADTSQGSLLGRVEVNTLALNLDTASIHQGQNLAAQFKAGNWRHPDIRVIPEGDPRLKLSGITAGSKTSFAVINGKTLAEGESATIKLKPTPLTVKCLKIETDTVTIAVDGEDTPRLLHLK